MRNLSPRLGFIDETSLKTNMAKTTGWSPRGARLIDHAPFGHWNTQTFIAALRHDRLQARIWADDDLRIMTARRMYAMRLGEVMPHKALTVLRGIEGTRMKESYALHAQRVGIRWQVRCSARHISSVAGAI